MSERLARKRNAREVVRKLVLKAVFDYSLLKEGDRVLIAVSGGKDSSVLSWALSSLRPALPFSYELAALHISSDFCACCKKSVLAARLAEWEIPFRDLSVPIIGRLKSGEKMNCYWCSTQRRTELLRVATSEGFTAIALGHHLDDILETFFMNLLSSGTLRPMPVSLTYRKYPVRLIRPLLFLTEREVIACAEELELLAAACTCPFGRNSSRRDMRERLSLLTRDSSAVKRRMLRGLEPFLVE